jgi:hypothetical protein
MGKLIDSTYLQSGVCVCVCDLLHCTCVFMFVYCLLYLHTQD